VAQGPGSEAGARISKGVHDGQARVVDTTTEAKPSDEKHHTRGRGKVKSSTWPIHSIWDNLESNIKNGL
jgi:hypothetical protein